MPHQGACRHRRYDAHDAAPRLTRLQDWDVMPLAAATTTIRNATIVLIKANGRASCANHLAAPLSCTGSAMLLPRNASDPRQRWFVEQAR